MAARCIGIFLSFDCASAQAASVHRVHPGTLPAAAPHRSSRPKRGSPMAVLGARLVRWRNIALGCQFGLVSSLIVDLRSRLARLRVVTPARRAHHVSMGLLETMQSVLHHARGWKKGMQIDRHPAVPFLKRLHRRLSVQTDVEQLHSHRGVQQG